MGRQGLCMALSKLKLSLAFIENVIGLNNSLKALNRAQQNSCWIFIFCVGLLKA